MTTETSTISGREIVRLTPSFAATTTASAWDTGNTVGSTEPRLTIPVVNDGSMYVIQTGGSSPKLMKVPASGAAGAAVTITNDKSSDFVMANYSWPIGLQSGSLDVVSISVQGATAATVLSVTGSTGAGKASEVVKFTQSAGIGSVSNFITDSSKDVFWWHSNVAAGAGKLSIYKWRNPLFVKPVGPVPAVSSKNLDYATDTPESGTKLTFTGTDLNVVTAVKFGSVSATIGSKTATSLEVTVPAGTGIVALSLESPNGNGSGGNFTYVGASKVAQTVALTSGANTAKVGDADRTLSATASMQGYTATQSISYSSSTPLVCTVVGATLHFVAAGTCTIKATQAGSGWAAEGSSTANITVSANAIPTVTAQVSGKATNTPAAGTKVTITGTNLDKVTSVTFGNNAATVGTRSATSLEVTVPAGSTGTVNVTLVHAGGTVAAGTFTYVGANKVAQTVALTSGANTAKVGDADRTLSATSSMQGFTADQSISYSSSTPLVCTVVGNKLHFVAAGTCTIKATQAGSGWAAEGSSTANITVSAAVSTTPTVTAQISGKATNTPAAGTKATITGTNLDKVTSVKFGNATATVGARSATSLEVTVPAGSTGTVNVTLVHAGGTVAAGTFTYVGATKVAQAVTLSSGAATAVVGDADRTLSATVKIGADAAVASLTFSSSTPLVCTVVGTKLKFVAFGTCTVKATQAGSAWAAEGTATANIVVKKPQTVTVNNLSAPEKLASVEGVFLYASSTSGGALTYTSSTPTVCNKGTYGGGHVLNIKPGTCTFVVAQAGDATWAPASATITYTVGAAGTTAIVDPGNVTAPVTVPDGGEAKKINVLSEVVFWDKANGALNVRSRGIWVGPITETATFKVGNTNYTCTQSYGVLKGITDATANQVKGFASRNLCSGTSVSDKAALAALKGLKSPITVKVVVVRDLRNPANYNQKGQNTSRTVYLSIG